jgi:colicin import membrane protein
MGVYMLTSKAPKKFIIPYVEFPCPNCEHRLRVKYEYLGGKLRCKYCAHEFVSPSAEEEEVPWTSSGQHEAEEDPQAAQRRIAVLETELGSLRDELSSRTAEYTSAAEKFQQGQDELRRLQDQTHQGWADQRNATEFKQKLLAVQSELQSVREELSSRTAESTAASENFQRAQDELRRFEEQVHQAWTDQRNAAELNQKLVSELEALRTQAPLGRESVSAASLQADCGVDAAAVQRSQVPPSSGASATRRQLLEKAQSIRAQLEASSSVKERIDHLNAELEAARADKDRLTGKSHTAAAEATHLRDKVVELEHSLAELTTAHADTSQALQQGQAQWENQRQALHRDWEEKHQSHLREVEQQFEEDKARIESDRSLLQEQLEAVRQKHEQESASLRSQVEQLHQERDAALLQVQVVGDKHNRSAAERDEIDARYKEAVEGFRADMARLTQAWQESRQQEAAAAAQNHALTEQLEKLRTELDQHHGHETEHQQSIAALQQAAEAARAEATAEKERAVAERQQWLDQLDAAQRRFDENDRSLRSQVEQLREEINALQEALEIVGVVAE